MTAGQVAPGPWTSRTVEIKVWKILATLIILPILAMWFKVVHQDDEILALVRNEVVTEGTNGRSWAGSFVNTNGRALRDVSVTVDFLDSQNMAVGRVQSGAPALQLGERLEVRAPLPPNAARLRIYSVQWRMDTTAADRWLRRAPTAALMGPFREPWEFGYVMANPEAIR